MPHFATSELGLHCLYNTLLTGIRSKKGKQHHFEQLGPGLYIDVFNDFFYRWCNAARINELKFSNSMSILKTMYERQLQGDPNLEG